MHDTACEHGRLFFELYWDPAFSTVVELGSQNVNGSLRDHCPAAASYIGMDMVPANGVDLVVTPGEPFPLADESTDVAVTSSAFEHDVCFWETFLDLVRLLRPGGLLYVNAPSNHAFHRYPVDCWRFYPDAGVALVAWAARRGIAVELVESFVAAPRNEGWADFVAVFRKASSRPLTRRGRIADHSRAMNIHDGARKAGPEIENQRPETFDMLAAADLAARLMQAERAARDAGGEAARQHADNAALQEKIAALTARIGARDAELADLSEARRRLETDLKRIRASASWRITAPVRRVSALLKKGRR
ncbi:methyltransferase domain-containing protein [Mycobacterium sp. KBS0706]|uniref:methyltransferase domain-containing protein n=1 Tax=Mycobacterium sp. KBS0706 TaxID=2578109 RepID=UPI00110FD15D|nr:methyltransferase domain-containing protein [Mycobacterium sp. KBS0706]TSD84282.1 methyltransferase domain-containing protein [Mycobacterium sp. KBS0706]